ncbi:MAG TPA: saccharopine dehydrogenase NADP-binding domain-containing protein [Solirubrobacterales bacterium]|nr:saccharopine dehydrogenase NADP-binding domain-containing protein [Solirubrobacterales bacterium]
MSGCEVAVVGAGGAQAQAMLEAAARAESIAGWVAVDRDWGDREREACERLGMKTEELDLLEEPNRLRELALDADLVANFAGPYHRTGTAVLEACIDARCDYLDICDDADVTSAMLERDEAVRAAGIRALVGMGSSPGLTNILIRAARDWLGEADEVSLSWVVDVSDVSDTALQQFRHILAPLGPGGELQPVPAWEELELRTVEFPKPLGERLVVGIAHPEPITVPRFLGIETVRIFGGVVPEDSMVVNWAMARLGASDDSGARMALNGSELPVTAVASGLHQHYLETRAPAAYLGGGLVVDVWSGEEGVRFSCAERTSMEKSTGVPAAAGVRLMLEAGPEDPGVIAPECLDPVEFFPRLGRTSRGTGSLGAYRLWGSEEGVRIRVRDLLMTRTH